MRAFMLIAMVGSALTAGAGEETVLNNDHWEAVAQEGALTELHFLGGRNLAHTPIRLATKAGAVALKARTEGDAIILESASPAHTFLRWSIDLGPDGYYDRLTETTYDGLVDGKPVKSGRQDAPALLRFISGAKGHTHTAEAMKRMNKDGYNWGLSNPGGETLIILTADGTQFVIDHGPGGVASFSFEDGSAMMTVQSPSGKYTLRPYEHGEEIVLEDGARLPRFAFGSNAGLATSTGGTAELNTLLNQFYMHAGFWYPAGHGISAWTAWGPLGHAYVDAPYRTESRNACAGQVVSDDGYGHDGYAWSWGDRPGWPFPGGFDTRHFGINAMHIYGAKTYLLWTGEYGQISGRDFAIKGTKKGKPVFDQSDASARVQILEGRVYSQGLTIETPIDQLALALDVPVLDLRFDENNLRDRTEYPADPEGRSIPLRIEEQPAQCVAQQLTPSTDFNTVGTRFCNWGIFGSGARMRVFPWAGSYEASLARDPLGTAVMDDVPDNKPGFVTLEAMQPAGATVLLVVDEPTPPKPGETATGGVWARGDAAYGEDTGLFLGGKPQAGRIAPTTAAVRIVPALSVRVLNEAGEAVAETRLDKKLPKGRGDAVVSASLEPGEYAVEVQGNGGQIYWYSSHLKTALGGRARDDGHSWDWLERARREMRYQMDILNARDQGLLLLDGKAGDDDHSGVTEVTVGNHYYDILPFGYFDAYTNAWFHESLRCMAELEKAYGDPEKAAAYEAFMAKSKARYNEVFWTDNGHADGAARYIGCVDAMGDRHDYGYTFVNTLALDVGLAPADRAEAVLRWLDEGVSIWPDGTKTQDIYHFVFGPRTTTIDNPDWWAAHQRYEAYPFQDQIQNGGADLYETYYDIQARLKTRGADDAYARFLAMLGRYAEPDRLTGGKRLYTGESIQGGGSAGGVGILSFEFPETAILAGIVLYGFLGADARADGLHLNPKVPEAQPFIRAENILYHGDYFHFTATKDSLEITAEPREGRYDFTINGETLRAPFTKKVALGTGDIVIGPKALE